MAVLSNLSVDQGSDFSAEVVVEDSTGNVANLTGYTGAGQIRKTYTSTTATNFGVVVTNATNGLLTLTGDITGSAQMTNLGSVSIATTLAGGGLAESIQDTVGAMVGSNTETGISVTYEDGDGTLDFVIGNDAIVESMVADDAIGADQMKTLSTLLIINSAGTTVKTLHGAGA